jgi:hypothetical protein
MVYYKCTHIYKTEQNKATNISTYFRNDKIWKQLESDLKSWTKLNLQAWKELATSFEGKCVLAYITSTIGAYFAATDQFDYSQANVQLHNARWKTQKHACLHSSRMQSAGRSLITLMSFQYTITFSSLSLSVDSFSLFLAYMCIHAQIHACTH